MHKSVDVRSLGELATVDHGRPFTVSTFAGVAGLSRQTVRKLIRCGHLAAFRTVPNPQGKYRIPFEVARTFIAERAVSRPRP